MREGGDEVGPGQICSPGGAGIGYTEGKIPR
jgi:hypothetical protein